MSIFIARRIVVGSVPVVGCSFADKAEESLRLQGNLKHVCTVMRAGELMGKKCSGFPKGRINMV